MEKYISKFSKESRKEEQISLNEEKFTFDRMTKNADEKGYYWLVYKDSKGREIYPIAYSKKYVGDLGDKLASIVSKKLI